MTLFIDRCKIPKQNNHTEKRKRSWVRILAKTILNNHAM